MPALTAGLRAAGASMLCKSLNFLNLQYVRCCLLHSDEPAVCLVTGASQGIGACIARSLAAAGCKVRAG